ncbi:MAG TPA: DUF2059 domain-containing protein [Caldimonas sp.]|jgi:hypothetical protein|nr:DUF2059 domain-containing protein [Caldimonas sp.]
MTRPLTPALIALAAIGLAGHAAAQTTPAKKELVQRLLRLQQADIEGFARSVVERPAAQMMRDAGLALQQQPGTQEKREAAAKAIEAEVRKYIDDAYPIVRDRALKLAPSTIGSVFETKMTEDELKQLIAWLESPTAKKYQQLGAELRNNFSLKLVADMPGVLDPKLQALDGRIRTILGVAPASGVVPAPAAAPPRPASK